MKKLIYYSDFYDNNGHEVGVNIYKEGFTGSATRIFMGDDPVNIQYKIGDDIFKPTKLSGCTLSFVTKTLLEDLYTSKITDIQIDIVRDGDLIWTGYNSPNVFNQPYQNAYDTLTINGIDRLSALKYFNYSYINSDHGTVTMSKVIAKCLSNINLKNAFNGYDFDGFYYAGTLDTMDSEETNPLYVLGKPGLLRDMYIQERVFFDEKNEADTCLKVLEEICKILGVTVYQDKNRIMFIDIELIKKGYKFFVGKYDMNGNYIGTDERPIEVKPKEYKIFNQNTNVSLNKVYSNVRTIASLEEYEDTIFDFGGDTVLTPLTNKITIGTVKNTDTTGYYFITDVNAMKSNTSGYKDDYTATARYYNVTDGQLNYYDNAAALTSDMILRGQTSSIAYDTSLITTKSYTDLADNFMENKGLFEIVSNTQHTFTAIYSGISGYGYATEGDNYSGLVYKINNREYKSQGKNYTDLVPLPDVDSFLEYSDETSSVTTYRNLISKINNTKARIGSSYKPVYKKSIKKLVYNKEDYLILSFSLRYSSQLLAGTPVNSGTYTSDTDAKTYGGVGSASPDDNISMQPYTHFWDYKPVFCNQKNHSSVTPFIIMTTLKIGDWYYTNEPVSNEYTLNGVTYNQGQYTIKERWQKSFGYLFIKGDYVNTGDSVNQAFKPFNDNYKGRNLYSSTEGTVIPLSVPDENPNGALEFTIYDTAAVPAYYNINGTNVCQMAVSVDGNKADEKLPTKGDNQSKWFPKYIHISDLKIDYTSYDKTSSVFDLDEEIKDLVYKKQINSGNVEALSDISLNINTQNRSVYNKPSYTYLMKKQNQKTEFIEKLYKTYPNDYVNDAVDADIYPQYEYAYAYRPEEHVVKRYSDYYSSPKYIISDNIKGGYISGNYGYSTNGINPIDCIEDTHFGQLTVGDIKYNLLYNNAVVKLHKI